jgi:hypothetical protein
MSTVTKFNAVTLIVAALLAMVLASPSWAGEPAQSNPPAAIGGMGFGPMPVALLNSARLTKPIRGEEPVPSVRGPEMIAARDQLPATPPPQALPPSVAVGGVLTVASRRSADGECE